jgi:hypothetical protein
MNIKKATSWDKGRDLESRVVQLLKPYDKCVRYEKGSGNQGNTGDIRNNLDLAIECKNHKGKHINVDIGVYDKLLSEMPFGCKKVPLVVRQVDDGRAFVVIKLEDFINDFIDVIYAKDE